MPRPPANSPLLDWLLEGDPAIRWQALRDLAGAPERVWRAERRRVATSGWGRRLLERQRPDGNWGRGPYQPKWTCTTYTMQLLWQLGLPPDHPAARAALGVYLRDGIGADGGVNFWRPRRKIGETCVTGMIHGQLAYFGASAAERAPLLAYLRREQLADGGWNCRRPEGATHSSFHTTLSVLEGLPDGPEAARGRELLLAHRLFRSHRTGRVVASEMTRFHFPPGWRYDVLRALDHFRAADARDPRLADAIELVEERRAPDGTWRLARPYPGAVHFVLEPAGRPSRWNTLRALRILSWWRR